MERDREVIRKIFNEIDNAIEIAESDVPVKICDSKFLKLYNKIKERYLR